MVCYRYCMSTIKIKAFTDLNKETLMLIHEFETAVFSAPLGVLEIERELQSKFSLLTLVAYINEVPCGYKIGYEQSAKRFYSWVGGVLPAHRGQGVAKTLMKQQHDMVKSKGYQYVTTQTKNEFKDMLILNLNSGFDVIGVRQSLGSPSPAILLEKKL